jgi:hypothetical protein
MRKQRPKVFHRHATAPTPALLTFLYEKLQDEEQLKGYSKTAKWTYWNLLTLSATTSLSSVTERPGPTSFMRMEWLNMILVGRSIS